MTGQVEGHGMRTGTTRDASSDDDESSLAGSDTAGEGDADELKRSARAARKAVASASERKAEEGAIELRADPFSKSFDRAAAARALTCSTCHRA